MACAGAAVLTSRVRSSTCEQNFIISQHKPYYLVRMIPITSSWCEASTIMAFPPTIIFKQWLPGERMPNDLVDEVVVGIESGDVLARQ